jgi:hypothetical protein
MRGKQTFSTLSLTSENDSKADLGHVQFGGGRLQFFDAMSPVDGTFGVADLACTPGTAVERTLPMRP